MKATNLLRGPMRAPFLILTPACVFLGFATALWTAGSVNIHYAALVLLGGLCAHISVNAFNEYSDFRSGLDSKTKRTPFSGGSGILPAHPSQARAALATALVAFGITAAVGGYFVLVQGPGLLWVGLAGLFLLFSYTIWLTRNPLVCLIAPGLGFGTCMVMGTHFALSGDYSWTALVASLIPFFLVSNLLLLNQFPDVDADRAVGRRHFPIVAGRWTNAWIYDAFLLATYLSILLGLALGLFPVWSLLGLATLILAVPTAVGVLRYSDNIERLLPYMGFNVILNLTTPVLVGIGFLIG